MIRAAFLLSLLPWSSFSHAQVGRSGKLTGSNPIDRYSFWATPPDTSRLVQLEKYVGDQVEVHFHMVQGLSLGTLLLAQQPTTMDTAATARWSLAIGVFRSFAPAGQVSVRENVYTGTPLDFQRDLGMRPWSSLQLEARYRLKNTATLALAAEHFLFSGSATSNRDIWYNGVHMTGADGLSPARTVLYRIQLAFEKKIHPERKVHPVLCAGLVADFLDFHVEGTVLPDTWGHEQHERFARQALPYPFLGTKLIGRLGTHDQLVADLSGTRIPAFKSFFDEGGPMWLQYATLQAGLDYGHRWGRTTLQLGVHYRTVRIHQESPEDTNDVLLQAPGVRLRLERTF